MPRRNSPNDIRELGDLSRLAELVVDKRHGKRAAARKNRRNRHYESSSFAIRWRTCLAVRPLRTRAPTPYEPGAGGPHHGLAKAPRVGHVDDDGRGWATGGYCDT